MLIRAFPKAKPAGFTLVELMIGMVVLTILVSLGMPSFLAMLRNAEIRAAAESVANGVQRARAEAVSRNTKVQFVLLSDTSWRVDLVPATDPLDFRNQNEGSAHTTLVGKALNTAVSPPVVDADSLPATTVTFNQLGQVVANTPLPPPGNPTLAQVDFSAPSGSQALRVTIGAGGNVRVCDPNPSAAPLRRC